jgi:alpha-N-arabinofuranosidase
MPRPALTAVFAALSMAVVTAAALAEPVAIRIRTDKVANTISSLVYGHFFEHIYNGGDNGLWGEMVWNRSFEYVGNTTGKWTLTDGVLAQTALSDGPRTIFGDPKWHDYDYTIEARKVSGREGFLILVRATDDSLVWANLGGWGNTGHQFQNVGGPRNMDFDTRVRGRIETDRWYKIRVRAEGSRLQAWIDDELVLSSRIPAEFDHPGAVGVGSWQTSVEYRNAKVTALDGKVLFQGAPELPKVTQAAGIHWNILGGNVQLTDANAFNDDFAVHIKGDGTAAEIGISQKNFCLTAGETYRGSLFLKGSSPTGGKVRFLNGSKTVAEVSIPAPGQSWKEYPIAFTSSVDAPDATLQLVFPPTADVTVDQVSLMAGASIKNDGFRPDIYEAFAALKPTIIRWPGGCYLEQYHWKHGIGPQSQRKKSIEPMWDDYDPNALGTDEYLTLCRKLGAEPLLVVNTGMHVTGTKNAQEWAPWIQEACEWVEYVNGPATSPMGKLRAANGHPEPYKVKYFEIDNELWRSKVTNPAIYAQAVPLFAAAMKKVDPNIIVMGHGGNGTDQRYNNVLLRDAAPSFDILSIHHYTDPNGFESGVVAQDKLYADTIRTIGASRNPDIKLYVSEWNLQTTDWRAGLYAGGLLNTFEKYGATLQIGGPALLFRHTSARDWDNAFINFDHKGYFVAPNYVVMKLWRDHYAPERLETEAPANSRLNLIATRTKEGDKVILKAVNPTNTPAEVTATLEDPRASFANASATFTLVAPGNLRARNTMENRDAVKPLPGEVKLDGRDARFTMPPLSAGVVTIARPAAAP